jgi:hypothetical protein
VLDLEHDSFTLATLKAYATACHESHPALARDLTRIAMAVRSDPSVCGCREAMGSGAGRTSEPAAKTKRCQVKWSRMMDEAHEGCVIAEVIK